MFKTTEVLSFSAGSMRVLGMNLREPTEREELGEFGLGTVERIWEI
jgi:hypothetical protein